jgi:hypothetical protein
MRQQFFHNQDVTQPDCWHLGCGILFHHDVDDTTDFFTFTGDDYSFCKLAIAAAAFSIAGLAAADPIKIGGGSFTGGSSSICV